MRRIEKILLTTDFSETSKRAFNMELRVQGDTALLQPFTVDPATTCVNKQAGQPNERDFGMAGLWPVAPGENRRMVLEKWPAFVASGTAAGVAAMQGRSPDRIATEALKPLRG